MTEQELTEALAGEVHAAWSGGMDELLRKCFVHQDGALTIAPEYVANLRRLSTTPFWLLDLGDQQPDRDEVERYMAFIRLYIQAQVAQTVRYELERRQAMQTLNVPEQAAPSDPSESSESFESHSADALKSDDAGAHDDTDEDNLGAPTAPVAPVAPPGARARQTPIEFTQQIRSGET